MQDHPDHSERRLLVAHPQVTSRQAHEQVAEAPDFAQVERGPAARGLGSSKRGADDHSGNFLRHRDRRVGQRVVHRVSRESGEAAPLPSVKETAIPAALRVPVPRSKRRSRTQNKRSPPGSEHATAGPSKGSDRSRFLRSGFRQVTGDSGNRRCSERFHQRRMLRIKGHRLMENVRIVRLRVRGQLAHVVRGWRFAGCSARRGRCRVATASHAEIARDDPARPPSSV